MYETLRRYNYDAEPFSVRRKDFWPLTDARKVRPYSQYSVDASFLPLLV
jgi:hypothetical protein